MDDPVTSDEVRQLLDGLEDATDAYVQGDMDRYLQVVHHAPGFTLLPPTGGRPLRYENRSEDLRAAGGGFIVGGDAKLESVEVQAWGDTAVIAVIERQHGQVAGRPDQDCSLRVTEVFRRVGTEWLLVHRHADPLVESISLDHLGALIRGDGADPTQQ